jgi:hypothetical protein
MNQIKIRPMTETIRKDKLQKSVVCYLNFTAAISISIVCSSRIVSPACLSLNLPLAGLPNNQRVKLLLHFLSHPREKLILGCDGIIATSLSIDTKDGG